MAPVRPPRTSQQSPRTTSLYPVSVTECGALDLQLVVAQLSWIRHNWTLDVLLVIAVRIKRAGKFVAYFSSSTARPNGFASHWSQRQLLQLFRSHSRLLTFYRIFDNGTSRLRPNSLGHEIATLDYCSSHLSVNSIGHEVATLQAIKSALLN